MLTTDFTLRYDKGVSSFKNKRFIEELKKEVLINNRCEVVDQLFYKLKQYNDKLFEKHERELVDFKAFFIISKYTKTLFGLQVEVLQGNEILCYSKTYFENNIEIIKYCDFDIFMKTL